MKTIENLQYLVLSYHLNGGENGSIKGILKEIGKNDFLQYAEDISNEINLNGYAKLISIGAEGPYIQRITLQGKEFVEKYISENSDFETNHEIINSVIEATRKIDSVNSQLNLAKKYLESSDNRDYKNAIKESICAVETAVRIILKDNKITLGNGIKEIEKIRKIHPAFLKSISNMYGFVSDSGGFRHGIVKNDYIPNYSEAKLIFSYNCIVLNFLLEQYDIESI
jgi:hypothetical protein